MKKILASAAVLASILASMSSFAATGFAAAVELDFNGLQTISKVAFTDFTAANPAHVQHFTGFKAWKSGDDGRVKIYVNHDGMAMEFSYLCHFYDEGPECHLQH